MDEKTLEDITPLSISFISLRARVAARVRALEGNLRCVSHSIMHPYISFGSDPVIQRVSI